MKRKYTYTEHGNHRIFHCCLFDDETNYITPEKKYPLTDFA